MEPRPTWLGWARTPSAEECSIALLLQARAAKAPDGSFAVFPDGPAWSNADAFAVARQTAAALAARGIGRGDRIIIWLPNSAAHLRVMFGAALLGAVPVPLNPGLLGRPLEQALRLADARLLVTVGLLAERLRDMSLPDGLQTVVLANGPGTDPVRETGEHSRLVPGQPWDLGVILYTSGTTVDSKAGDRWPTATKRNVEVMRGARAWRCMS